ncbi:lysine exporter lyso [Lucifera butyrica]|uniref:Lysine exporter lyso n=1 Tax=Lucifera butyrica TaxID=1351585 RepID=A0A498R6R5_9FIRM|nr:lysine exporter LysO family protein [Lucifera butyrica]VBB05962.1 lysine exporter lyso [Lucifera butyrica]
MVIYILLTVLAGIGTGRFFLPPGWVHYLDRIVTCALVLMIFGVGLDIGRNRDSLKKIKQLGWKVLLMPLSVAVGSLTGAAAAKFILSMPLKEVLAVSAGFGWYSLSGVLIARLYSVELGTTAFLSNVFRELIAFILIPVLAGYVGKITAVAPGGATTMDSTLPLISKVTDTQTALLAFMSGLTLTALVPLLVPFFLSW